MAKASLLLLTNIGQLLTLRSGGRGPRRGTALKDVAVVEDAAVLCASGRIVAVGRACDALKDAWLKRHRKRVTEIDCGGRVALPGFVDSHTHPAFMAPRLVDFEQRSAGASYEQVAQLGGGILSSMGLVRNATRAQLAERVLAALSEMAHHGTTTVEAKSGYGLSLDDERKSLEAIGDAASRSPGTVIRTLLAAHVVPPEYARRRDDYVNLICKVLLPEIADDRLAAFADVFVERGAFSAIEAEKIMGAAHAQGLGIRLHVGQFTATTPGWIGAMAARFQIASLDHMDLVAAPDIHALSKLNTVVTLVPASNYFLGLGAYPPARNLLDVGVAVALATDFNPGTAPTASMPFVLSLACTQMKLTPAEAISAATINGAHALGLAERKGSIEPGKDADVALFDVRDWREIPYWIAAERCWAVVAGGALQLAASA